MTKSPDFNLAVWYFSLLPSSLLSSSPLSFSCTHIAPTHPKTGKKPSKEQERIQLPSRAVGPSPTQLLLIRSCTYGIIGSKKADFKSSQLKVLEDFYARSFYYEYLLNYAGKGSRKRERERDEARWKGQKNQQTVGWDALIYFSSFSSSSFLFLSFCLHLLLRHHCFDFWSGRSVVPWVLSWAQQTSPVPNWYVPSLDFDWSYPGVKGSIHDGVRILSVGSLQRFGSSRSLLSQPTILVWRNRGWGELVFRSARLQVVRANLHSLQGTGIKVREETKEGERREEKGRREIGSREGEKTLVPSLFSCSHRNLFPLPFPLPLLSLRVAFCLTNPTRRNWRRSILLPVSTFPRADTRSSCSNVTCSCWEDL